MKLTYEEKDIYIIKSKNLPKYIIGEDDAYMITSDNENTKGYKIKSSSFSNTILIKDKNKIYKVKKLYELEDINIDLSQFLFNLEQSTLDKIHYYTFDEIECKYGLSHHQIYELSKKYRFVIKENMFFILKYNVILEILTYYDSILKLGDNIDEEMDIYPEFVKQWVKKYYNEKELVVYEQIVNFLQNKYGEYNNLLEYDFILDYIKNKIQRDKCKQ
ncbi:hypothetical protein SLOPH_1722 [Spraguea lophii 42_110]|uniref:Uncharacterized protein n=1 Tax=Spraguea lophii (strain 42_110) TaxID=1358809 RepID=S7WAC0_SPRLO|nr:hypothetical protein SLOPH_1722 [Spraguea lophii 42_110]